MSRSFAQWMAGKQRNVDARNGYGADAVLGALVIVIVAMMIVPLPTPLIDLLIAGNLALGVVMMLVALYAREAMSFTALPTVLLVTTLYRLALNVSSTRLILLQADAGTIIRAFGDFVVRGDYLVGGVIFLILTLIQYVVIARGAERVAEVGARFSLDAMPGKQLAIDADLRLGALSVDAANRRRRALERESQLYGAMDGAMKFVKGDAIASIAISLINLVAGAAIGVSARGLDLVTSLKTYGLLTVGDGLVSQIPALLITTSAAIVVTRVAAEEAGTSLAREIGAQLLGTPRVLWTSSALLLVLALVPGLPLLPFALVALSSAALALIVERRGQAQRQADAMSLASAQRVVVLLSPELHARALASDPHGQQLQRDVAQAFYERSGLQLMGFSLLRDVTLGEGGGARFKLLIDGAGAVQAEALTANALCSQLIDALSGHARLLFGIEHTQRLLDTVAQTQPTLVRSLVPSTLSLSTLTLVLARLLDEGVSLRHAHMIFDRLATVAPRESDVTKLAQSARACLQRQLSEQLAPHGALDAYQLDPLFLDLLRDALTQHTDGEHVALPPRMADEMIAAISATVERASQPVLLTPDRVRRAVHLLVRHELPQLRVVGVSDLSPHVTVTTLSWIGPGV